MSYNKETNPILFDQLRQLVNEVEKVNSDFGSYKNCAEARKILQEIKKESQALRVRLNDAWRKV